MGGGRNAVNKFIEAVTMEIIKKNLVRKTKLVQSVRHVKSKKYSWRSNINGGLKNQLLCVPAFL